MPVIVNDALPVFVSVTACAALVVLTCWFPNERLVGEKLTAGTVPVPARLTFCGLLLALSVMVMAPVRVPVAVGVKVTLMVHLAPAATEMPQSLVCAKSPPATMLEIVSGALPVLVSLTGFAVLVVPTACFAKVRLVFERETV